MSKKLNLTSLKVKKELEFFLRNHSAPNYQIIVKDTEFRQKLIFYILQRIPNQYLPIKLGEKLTISSQVIQCSSLEKIQIEKLIYQGFYRLIQEHNNQTTSLLKDKHSSPIIQPSDLIEQEAV
jgi:hypothetical protein